MRKPTTTAMAMAGVALIVVLHVVSAFARPGGGNRFSSPSPAPAPYSPPSPAPAPYSPPSPAPAPYSSPSPAPAPYSSPFSDDSSSDYSGYSGGGGGGGGDTSPATILLFLGVLVVFWLVPFVYRMTRNRQDWSMGASDFTTYSTTIEPPRGALRYTAPPETRPMVRAPDNPRRSLVKLLSERDPNFSLVLFEDFLYALFTAYHEARGGSRRHDVSPYVDEDAERFLESGKRDEVRSVIVGAMRLTRVRDVGEHIAIEVQFEANYAEVEAGRTQAYYTLETWVLQRGEDAKSRSPERASIDECPNCGGALENMDGNVCSYCNEALTPGRFDWAVTSIRAERETRGPMLIGEVAEVGTDRPTVVVEGAQERFKELTRRDRAFSWPAFQQRVGIVFDALHLGWTAREWKRVRPYVSDQLFQSQLYWIEEYRRQKLNNRTDGARIVSMQISDVISDTFFDAITVRVFATGKDYTVDADGKLVSGSKTFDRYYSEYWTLIRGREASGSASHLTPTCPNCGADIAVTMAGACEHCDVKVSRGDFDWVLSRIEQDETYR